MYIPGQLEIQYLWSQAQPERVGSLFVLYLWPKVFPALAPNCSSGNKSCLIFGGKSSGTSGGCNRISWYPRTWVWPPVSRTQDPNTDWSHSLPKYPISLLLIMFPDLKEDEYTQFSGQTKHLMKYFLCKLRNYFSTIQAFYQRELTQVFEMLRTKSVWVGAERTAAGRRRGQCLITLFVMDWQ